KEFRQGLEEQARLLGLYQNQSADLDKAREAEKRLHELLEKYPENSSAARDLKQLLETQVQGKMQGQLQFQVDPQGMRHAKVIYRVEPEYTEDARMKQITGSVLLTVTVGHDGLPQSIQVKRSLFPSLDQSAIEAARKMRFEPAMKDGQPVSEVLLVEFFFSMETKRISGEGAGVGMGKGIGQGDGVGSGSGGAFGVRRRKEPGQEDPAGRQAELVQGATISMDRAIQIATSKYP